MLRSLWIAKTGMEGQQTQLDSVAHNLANVVTNGFKRGGVVFEDLMYQNLRPAGSSTSEQSQLVEFLKSLTSDPLPAELTAPPVLP